MKVLVSAASKHGATADIASAIAETLEVAGLEAAVLPPDEVTSLAGYDAVVLGSGVYVGHWMDPAKHLVERLGAELEARHVWLFSSGPVGDPPKPEEDPADLADMMAATAARGHRQFAGLVDRSRLGLGEKVILTAVRAPEGDFRPWDEIRAWANEIAAELKGAWAAPADDR
jgi:menaquinone-dependent protoporphyrinogen oxidase